MTIPRNSSGGDAYTPVCYTAIINTNAFETLSLKNYKTDPDERQTACNLIYANDKFENAGRSIVCLS